MKERINVLDKGYVRLIETMGSDLEIVNDARVSFAKESGWDENGELKKNDKALVDFLVRRKEMSPFRGCVMKFECKVPIVIARQWFKYSVASTHRDEQFSWNEVSRRYVTMEPEFYIPETFRSSPENRKQGSGGPIDPATNERYRKVLESHGNAGVLLYERAIQAGIAPEEARYFLPYACTYTIFRWTTSLQALCFFLTERLADKAQWALNQYAQAVHTFAKEKFPIAVSSLVVVE